jgi:hypothetical protein
VWLVPSLPGVRGSIETLPSGSLRVKVYVGIDPVSKKRLYLEETIPAGPRAAKEAEKARTRLLAQVDERHNPRTRATVNQMSTATSPSSTLNQPPGAPTTATYATTSDRRWARLPLARLEAETIESFYAQLRICRSRCGGKRSVEHRTSDERTCDAGCRGTSASRSRRPRCARSTPYSPALASDSPALASGQSAGSGWAPVR